MITFKQYMLESRVVSDSELAVHEREIEVMMSNFKGEPFRIEPLLYDINDLFKPVSVYHRNDGIRVGKRLERSDDRVFHVFVECFGEDRMVSHYMTYPSLVDYIDNFNLTNMDHTLLQTNNVPISMRSIDFLTSEFNIFNYYLSLTDPEPIRKIKTLEFAKKERAVWNDTCDIVLNQLKIKYTPEDVTDDDHALNAAHNL